MRPVASEREMKPRSAASPSANSTRPPPLLRSSSSPSIARTRASVTGGVGLPHATCKDTAAVDVFRTRISPLDTIQSARVSRVVTDPSPVTFTLSREGESGEEPPHTGTDKDEGKENQ